MVPEEGSREYEPNIFDDLIAFSIGDMGAKGGQDVLNPFMSWFQSISVIMPAPECARVISGGKIGNAFPVNESIRE